MSETSIKPRSTSNNILNPLLDYVGMKTRVEFKGSFLKQDRVSFDHRKILNIHIVYEINENFEIDSYPMLENCLFGAVKLIKHPDIDQYKYSGYGIGFVRKGFFSLEIDRHVLIFGVDVSSSSHIDKKKKYILILGKGPTQGLEHTLTTEKLYSINFAKSTQGLKHTLTTEKLYSINFTKHNTKFCLSLYYNGANSYLFVNGTEINKFKVKDYEIIAYPLCLGNITKDFTVDNMRKIGLNGYVYDFSVVYNAVAVADILGIHKYSMKKNGILWSVWLY